MLEARKRTKRENFLRNSISGNPLFHSLFRNCVHLICDINIHVCICDIQFKSALFLYYQPNLQRQTLDENTI